jgi:hypothetical protein
MPVRQLVYRLQQDLPQVALLNRRTVNPKIHSFDRADHEHPAEVNRRASGGPGGDLDTEGAGQSLDLARAERLFSAELP